MMRYGALDRAGSYVVCVCMIEDLVLFIYSVQRGRKFHWQLGLYALHLTGTPRDPSSARLPSQIIV